MEKECTQENEKAKAQECIKETAKGRVKDTKEFVRGDEPLGLMVRIDRRFDKKSGISR